MMFLKSLYTRDSRESMWKLMMSNQFTRLLLFLARSRWIRYNSSLCLDYNYFFYMANFFSKKSSTLLTGICSMSC